MLAQGAGSRALFPERRGIKTRNCYFLMKSPFVGGAASACVSIEAMLFGRNNVIFGNEGEEGSLQPQTSDDLYANKQTADF